MSGEQTARADEPVIVVTGGARGIGDGIIQEFVAHGYRGVSVDLAEPETLRQRTRYLLGDVRSLASVQAAFADIDGAEGRVDVLVNNAGIQRLGLTDRFLSLIHI